MGKRPETFSYVKGYSAVEVSLCNLRFLELVDTDNPFAMINMFTIPSLEVLVVRNRILDRETEDTMVQRGRLERFLGQLHQPLQKLVLQDNRFSYEDMQDYVAIPLVQAIADVDIFIAFDSSCAWDRKGKELVSEGLAKYELHKGWKCRVETYP
ncbi:hypothetical protein CPC08DRAFT_771599 [Agrocybe pediades]|nr:hypothetical protein CPC08DRAFT_771599 [Agrocybe pediades]